MSWGRWAEIDIFKVNVPWAQGQGPAQLSMGARKPLPLSGVQFVHL